MLARRIAARAASTQLLCSRWGLESYWQALEKQHGGRQAIPEEVVRRLEDGTDGVRACALAADQQSALPFTDWVRASLYLRKSFETHIMNL